MPLPEQAPAGLAGALSAGTVVAALPQAGDVAGLGVPEDERPVDDAGLLGVRQRNLDDVDPEQRRVGVLRRRLVRAAFELVTRPHRGGARPVDVDVALAVGIAHQRVGVGSAAGLHCGHLPRAPHVADVKDTEAPEPLLAHRLRHSLQPAVEAASGLLDRHDEQVADDRDVSLAAGADHRADELRRGRYLHPVGAEPVVVPLEQHVAGERHVRVGEAEQTAPGPRLRLVVIRLLLLNSSPPCRRPPRSRRPSGRRSLQVLGARRPAPCSRWPRRRR